MIWVFAVVAAVAVFVVAAVAVGRETFRLGHQLPASVFDVNEAVVQVSDGIPAEVQARLSYEDVRVVVQSHIDFLQERGIVGVGSEDPAITRVNGDHSGDVVVADEEALAYSLGRVDEAGIEMRDEDAYAVIAALHRYLASIGAILEIPQ